MSRFSRGDKTPRVRPVQKIELDEKNIPLRLLLVGLCIAIAVACIGWGMSKLLSTEAGWKVIEVDCETVNCSQDFILNYDFTDDGQSATVRQRQLVSLYSDACEKAHWLFTTDEAAKDFGNMFAVNQAVNQTVSVDPVLYEAFELLKQKGSRELYLAPVYAVYDDLIVSESDVMAAEFDPEQNPEMDAYVAKIAEFAGNPNMIDLELLGDHQVRLKVSSSFICSCVLLLPFIVSLSTGKCLKRLARMDGSPLFPFIIPISYTKFHGAMVGCSFAQSFL